ncbi:MAG: hypothetical protein KDH20_09745 [Rhodocyclaceae bacterium]|nr:hypothetical protein [Rhodocyclaceae bacterium]
MTTSVPLLPGGLIEDGVLRRDFAFLPVDGRLELALADALDAATSTPAAVTGALQASLATLAGRAPERHRVDALCVADRQFLMRRLAALLGRHSGWYAATCVACKARFDFPLDPALLPFKPAGDGFPTARLTLGRRRLQLRVPTGADQIRVLGLPPEGRREALLRGLVEGDAGALPAELAPRHIDRCEAALEAVAPELACEVVADCPECGQRNQVEIDPYGALAHDPDLTLQEVHRLAWHYHWSEAEILAMPRGRRARYLELIDAARGMSQ